MHIDEEKEQAVRKRIFLHMLYFESRGKQLGERKGGGT